MWSRGNDFIMYNCHKDTSLTKEFLLSPADIKIRGHSCLDSLEYVSSKKLFCLTPDIVGAAEIVVETLSGGRGTCTVSYYGRAKEAKPLLGGGWVVEKEGGKERVME